MKLFLFLLFNCFTISLLASTKPMSTDTDYFRSKQKGNWSDVNTWETSANNTTWSPATLAPTITSASIIIKDSVFLTVGLPVDNLIINNGGVLVNAITAAGNRFIITNDGTTATDFTINNGGTLLITSTLGFTVHTSIGAGSRTVIKTGGKIKIGNGIISAPSSNSAYGSSLLFFWEDDAIFEWSSTIAPPMSSIDYFPTTYSTTSTTPIFLINYPLVASLGGTGNAFVHGRLETTVPLTFAGTGLKTFRGGIINSALLTFNEGKVVIDNDLIYYNCKIGGAGNIIVSGGLEIAGRTGGFFQLDFISNKLITGNITLIERALVNLNGYTITVDGIITGGSPYPDLQFFNTANSGVGILKIMNIGTTPVTFPVGSVPSGTADDIYNPVTIINNGIVDNFSVNVRQAYPPCLTSAQEQNSVKATWDIKEDVAGGSNVQLILSYGVDYGMLGSIVSLVGPGYASAAAKIVHCGATTADYANGSVNGTTVTGTGNGFTSFSPFGITSDPALLLFLPSQLKQFSAIPTINKQSLVQWKIDPENNINFYTVERSINGNDFTAIQTLTTTNIGNYKFIDASPYNGTNYYRLKINTKNSDSYYSAVQKVQFENNSFYVSSLFPSPAIDYIQYSICCNKATKASLQLYNVQGQSILQKQITFQYGNNNENLNISNLNKGIYYLHISTNNSTIVEKIVKQ